METISTRFANGTATQSDCEAAIWQLERMDYVDGRAPTMADAIATLAEIEAE